MTKSILAKTATGEIQLTITIPAEEVKKYYGKALEEITRETEIPGFRKGKAPQKLVEERVEKEKIYERVIQNLIPRFYLEAIKKHQLKPIIAPKVELLKAKEEEDWEIRATTCESPKIELGNYKEEIKKTLAPTKIWIPQNRKSEKIKEQGSSEELEEERIQKVIQKLLEIAKIELPEMLVEDEINRALSNLINQTNTLGLTIEQYLASIGKSAEQLRTEYRERVITQLKLQFILDKIAEEEKIKVSDQEINTLISATGDQKIKEDLNTPLQREYLKGVLERRKALDFLSKL